MPRYMATDFMPKLRWNEVSDEGLVVFPAGWKKIDSIERADLLRDWVYDLQKAYRDTVSELHEEIKEMVRSS